MQGVRCIQIKLAKLQLSPKKENSTGYLLCRQRVLDDAQAILAMNSEEDVLDKTSDHPASPLTVMSRLKW